MRIEMVLGKLYSTHLFHFEVNFKYMCMYVYIYIYIYTQYICFVIVAGIYTNPSLQIDIYIHTVLLLFQPQEMAGESCGCDEFMSSDVHTYTVLQICIC
jgi:hypothetical protein